MYTMSQKTNESGRAQAHISISEIVTITGYKFYGYAVPIVPNTNKKRVVYNNVVEMLQDGEYQATAIVSLARADMLAGTIYLGSLTF